MKPVYLRVWRGREVIACFEITERGMWPAVIGDKDHISIDPFAKLAGEVKNGRSASCSIATND